MCSKRTIRGENLVLECPNTVLAVDLDETLVQIDVLRSGVVRTLYESPFAVFQLGWSLLRGGRPGLKRTVSRFAPIVPANLPYNAAVIELIRDWRAVGRKVVLASAADETVVLQIAAYLDLFDAVHASRPGRNLKGRAKAELLVKEYGVRGFVYAGDSRADLHVWQYAAGAALARNDETIIQRLRALRLPVQIVSPCPTDGSRL